MSSRKYIFSSSLNSQSHMISKQTIEVDMINGKLRKAINQLTQLAKEYKDQDLYDFLILQSSRLSHLDLNDQRGTMAVEAKTKLRNEISFAIIKQLAVLPDGWKISEDVLHQNQVKDYPTSNEFSTGSISVSADAVLDEIETETGNINTEKASSGRHKTGDISLGKGTNLKNTSMKTGNIDKR